MRGTRASTRTAAELFDLNQAASVLLGLNSPDRTAIQAAEPDRSQVQAPQKETAKRTKPQNKVVTAAGQKRSKNNKQDVPSSSKGLPAGRANKRQKRQPARQGQTEAASPINFEAAVVPSVDSDSEQTAARTPPALDSADQSAPSRQVFENVKDPRSPADESAVAEAFEVREPSPADMGGASPAQAAGKPGDRAQTAADAAESAPPLPTGKLRGVQRKREGWDAYIYVPPGPVKVRASTVSGHH